MVKNDIAKLRKGSKSFEIYVYAEKASEFRDGHDINIQDAVVTEEIFSDARKGEKASESDLKKLFGTDDKLEICKVIIKQGHVPVTADMIRKDADQKKKQIIDMIHRTAVDPNTGAPHPEIRIENAIAEAKVKIDQNKSAEEQIKDIITKLRPIIPISYEIREVMVKIPGRFAGKAFGTLKQFGKILGENWNNDGSLSATIEIPAGMQEEFEIALNNLTKGQVVVDVIRSR